MVDKQDQSQDQSEVQESGSTDTTSEKETASTQISDATFEPLAVKDMNSHGQKAKSGSALSWILFVLILVSMGASGYLWLQLQHISADLMKASQFQLSEQEQKQTNEALEKNLQEAQAQLKASQETVERLDADLEMLKSKIAGISGVNRVDWLIDELQHLTRLAHQRLVLSHDAQGAIALLKAADQVAIEIRQSEALPIRQAIAADLLDLRMAAEVDLEGAYIRLDTLSQKMETLTFRQPRYPSMLSTDDLPKEESIELAPQGIEGQLSSALENIADKLQPYLFRTFRIDADVKPLLSADEREYMARNMLLTIEEAQLALLRREAESYRLSLEQTEKWISEYYDTQDPMTTSVLNLIAELKSYQLNPELPKIEKTLSSVKAFSEKWQQEKVRKRQLRRSLSQ